MGVGRFFVPGANIAGGQVEFEARQVHQVRDVLRLAAGDRVVVLDNAGAEYDVELVVVERQRVLGRVTGKRAAGGEPRVRVTLFQSLLSRDKFEVVLQKCTEVGVSCFVPVLTERSIVRDLKSVGHRKVARWERIILEASEQSGRGRLAVMGRAVGFADAVARLRDFERSIVAVPGRGGRSRDLRRREGVIIAAARSRLR